MIGKLDYYRIFNIVSQNKSFSKAAEELYMTQSAVSQAIHKLEKELATPLFHRTPKGVILTDEGKVLYEYVQSALGILHAGEEKLMEFKHLTTGQLRIGVGDTISRYFLLPYLETFHLKYPGVRLTVLNGTTSEIRDFIRTGEADIGVCNLPIQDEQLQVLPCKKIHDIFVCGEKYKNLTKKPVPLSLLMKMPLIFLGKKANSRNYVEHYLKEQGYHLTPEFELGSHDLLLQFAQINLGIACVTKEFAMEYLEKGLLYELSLQQPLPERSIGICHLKSVPLSRAARKFSELINPMMTHG
ncbi:LysR family transcriptional regulator [Metasolibacillus sp.]|uniref:LysR family transcriptional regulator n=1 Tax=Metasolibacillus sp. TaxID=2703680 RepID=UPI0025F28BD3|nr:LysR family transcriptional regulator [Metasolibacillus sp.]MCT6924544.1 LysR family transcriptional regulator [Metasolibacillus sp.]MCT6940742.1 LysR family transcriptional regulator [Metasolibacillus sp.]